MILQSAWILALLLVLAGQGLPGGSLPWTGGAIVLFAAAAFVVPHASWPYLGALLLLIAAANQIRLRYRAAVSGGGRRAQETEEVTVQTSSGPHVGSTATVSRAIRGGFGMVMIGDQPWQVCSDQDIPEGRTVYVLGNEGSYLTVQRVD